MSKNKSGDNESGAQHINESDYPSHTILHGTNSDSKRVTMHKWAHEAVSYVASVRNRKLTQGVLAYECLLFSYDELTDRLDSVESRLNESAPEKLDFEALDELKVRTEDEAEEDIRRGVENPEKKRTQVKVWLPRQVMQTAPWQRGWGTRLEDAVRSVYASAFSDRMDRIECKRQLIDYVENGRKPTHPIAVDVVSEDMGAYIDSPEILTEVIITDPDDYFAISDDLTRVNEQKEKMYELYENMPTLNKGNFVALLQKAHGHDSDYAKDRVEKWCEEYEIFDYAPIDEKTVTQDNFAELADELIDTERNEADLVNQLFATAEEEGEDTMSLEDVAEVLEEGGLIRTATHKTAGKKLQEYDERYGMTSFRYVDKGAVYLSTYAPSA